MSDFWKGKRVFVTGASGFLGTHLSKKLESLGAELGFFIHVNEVPLSGRRIYGDLQDFYPNLYHFLKGFSPHVVFNLASQPLVSVASVDELKTLQTNVGGTINLLNSCKNITSIKSYVQITTDKIFGNVSPITKDTPPKGFEHPYNASKLASDVIAQMYSNFFEIPMVVIRNANVYGAGDRHFDRIIPRTIFNVYQGTRPVIRGDGSNTRDYIHVDELIDGYLKAAELPYKHRLSVLNLGGHNYSVREVVDTILMKMRRIDLPVVFEKQWKGEIPHQHIVNDLSKELIGWNPKTDLSEGLDKTIWWYEEDFRGKS